MPIIITDIDGTLIDGDGPVVRVIDYVKTEAGETGEIMVLTNRPESDRRKTEQDLRATGLEYDALIMNPGSDPAPKFKADVVKSMMDEGQEVEEFIDNDAANRAAVAALGVEVTDPAEIGTSEDDDETETAKAGIDRFPKIKTTMSKITPEAENIELRAAAKALAAERDDLRASFEKLTSGSSEELAKAQATIVEKEKYIISLTDKLAAAESLAAAHEAKVKELEASKESAAKIAAKMVGVSGVAPLAVSPAHTAETSPTGAEVVAQYLAMAPGPERLAFFNRNKGLILSN